MPLINSEVSLTAQGDNPAIAAPTGSTFKKKDTELYVPVVTLSAENNNKLLEQLKTGFKRTVKWNKYRSDMSNQTRNNNLNYLINPAFTNVNSLFVLSLKMNMEMMMKMKVLELLSKNII